MVQRNQNTTKKGRRARAKSVNKKTLPKKTTTTKTTVNKPTTVNKSPDVAPVKNIDEHTITELGQKVKMLNDISTIDGTLYTDEVVKVEAAVGISGKELRVVDTLGRVWYVNFADISTKV